MRYICIHGHFYQPPRENPWLEAVEKQDSAYPFHDWNERITFECYSPNTASRILGKDWKIVDIVNNYSRISFNFGPTLLAWLEKFSPETYSGILEADRMAQARFSGHGTALAQVYNHMIMPLASSADKRTQVIWGIRDFEYRFARRPEGMWLAETAVDLETLEIMAECGIAYTILAPGQACRSRRWGEETWQDARGGKIDPRRPYLCRLPSGASINLFFYDGPISRDLAFSNLLENGEQFARRLAGAFVDNGSEPQLVHIATDGESYGHHRRFGDMALAYCLSQIEEFEQIDLTNYGQFLEMYPPEYEVQIYENTSWSCAHGVERWRGNCGCCSGSHPGWNQRWRRPLRDALDDLRDRLNEIFLKEGSSLFKNPVQARDNYIQVILNRSPGAIERFLTSYQVHQLTPPEKEKALKLLEMQRHEMLMFTSCGWFFDEISGLETVQIIQYAARAIQLARESSGLDLEPDFLRALEAAPSNIPDFSNGRWIYDNFVKPAVVDLKRVGAHFAVTSLFQEYPEEMDIYAYHISSENYDRRESGKQKCAVGRARVVSQITREEILMDFASLYLGNHNLVAAIEVSPDNPDREIALNKIRAAFAENNIPEVIRTIDRNFTEHSYSLWHLFRDEQRQVLGQIIKGTRKELEDSFRQLYRHHSPVIQILEKGGIPLPREMDSLEEFVLNADLRRTLETPKINIPRLQDLVEKLRHRPQQLDRAIVEYSITRRAAALMEEIKDNPRNLTDIRRLTRILKTVRALPIKFNLWEAQNIFFKLVGDEVPSLYNRLEVGDEEASKELRAIRRLGDQLRVCLPGQV